MSRHAKVSTRRARATILFIRGSTPLLEVYDSQLALTQSQLNRSQAVYSYLVAQAQLDETLGTEYTYEK